MGQLENSNYYRAGSFRVHGPYHTEKGKDTVEFIAKLIKVEQAEKKLEYYADNCNSKIKYLHEVKLTESAVLMIVVKDNNYDLGVYDKVTKEYRIDISQTEFNELVRLFAKNVKILSSCAEYAHLVNTPELNAKIENNVYFDKYDPVTNPIRGSPYNKKFNELFDR